MNKNNVELVISAGRSDQLIRDGLPQIAFSGRSNVGKSSTLNTILDRKHLARVSSSPGKTVTVNYYLVDKKFYLVDLPGYGFAKRTLEDKKKWSALTDSYFKNNSSLRAVLQLLDGKTGPSADDDMMLDYLNQTGINYSVILTKWDKLNATNKKKNLELFKEEIGEDVPMFPFSSLNGEGKAEVWSHILSILK